MFISFLFGFLIGIVYFGGLYYSTRKFKDVKNPAIFMFLSFIIRMAVLIAGFYYLAKIDYKNVLIGLIGVILVRFIMIFKVKNYSSNSMTREE